MPPDEAAFCSKVIYGHVVALAFSDIYYYWRGGNAADGSREAAEGEPV